MVKVLQADYAVKQLEWGKLLYTEDYNFMQSAETSIGKYVATDSGWFLQGQSDWYGADSLEDAKVAAQADFERRVRECLVPLSITKSSGCVFNDLGINKPADDADIAKVKHMAERSYEFDTPDQNGAWPDHQDAMVTVGELRALRRILPQIATKPVDVAAVREQALEEAAVLCEISVKVSQEQLDREQDRAVRAALRGEVAASNVLAKRIRALSAAPTSEAGQ